MFRTIKKPISLLLVIILILGILLPYFHNPEHIYASDEVETDSSQEEVEEVNEESEEAEETEESTTEASEEVMEEAVAEEVEEKPETKSEEECEEVSNETTEEPVSDIEEEKTEEVTPEPSEEAKEEVISEESKEEVEPSENAQPTKEELEKQEQEAKEKAEAEAKLKAEEEERARIEAEEEAIKTLDGMNFSSKRLIVEADAKTVEGEPVVGSYENTYLIQYETERDAKLGYLRMKDSASIIEIDREDTFVVSDDLELAPYEEPEQTPLKDEAEESNPIAEIENASNEIVKRYDVAVIDTGANTVDKVSVLGDDGSDSNGHGQAMVDTIKEIAPNAKVLSIKAIGGNGKGDTSAVYAAIKLAIENNVKIINLSIAAPAMEENAIIESVINEAIDKGITVVGAAGNHGRNAGLFLPGKVKRAIIVGVCDKDGNILKSFNYGNTVDYYVEAKSTSYAAATVTGLILRDGLDSLKQYANNAIVNEAEEEELGTTPEERRRIFALLTGGFGIQASDVSWLTAIRNEKIYYDDYGLNENGRCSVVTAKLSNGKTTTLCCVETNIVNGSFDFTYTDIREVTNQRLRKAAFYGNIFGKNDDKERTYGSNYRNVALEIVMGLGANADTSGASNYQEERAYLITHHATSKIVIDAGLNNHPDADWDWNANSSLQSDVNRFLGIIDSLPAPPDGYRVYLAAPPDYDTQMYLFDDMEPAPAKVDLIIKKVSYNQGQKVITDLNPNAFAVFKVQHLDTSGAVTRTWHFKTRTVQEAEAAGQPETAGVANIQNGQYLYNQLPNDTLYVMDGKVYFPEGTIVVEEIITPEGYFPAEGIKLTAVSSNVDGSFVASWSNWTKEQAYVTYRGIKKVRADGLRHDIVDVDNYSLTAQTNLQIKKYRINPATNQKEYLTLAQAKGVVFEMKVFPTDPTLDKRVYYDTVYTNVDGEVVINFANWHSQVTGDKNYESDKYYKSEPGRTGLPLGRVEIKEVKAPSGYELFPGVLKATVYETTVGGETVLEVKWDDETKALDGVEYGGRAPVVVGHHIMAETLEVLEPQDGFAKLIKTSTNASITNNNDCYDMRGIKYDVYKKNTGSASNPVLSEKVGTLEITSYNKTTSTGESTALRLNTGTYWVQENKDSLAGKSFAYNKEAKQVTVTTANTENNPATVSFQDTPLADPVGILLKKVNKDSTEVRRANFLNERK